MRHAVSVAAPAPAVWEALHRADFAGAWYVRALLMLRGLGRPGRGGRLTLARMVDGGFIPLGERPGREVAFGLVGRFWTPRGGRVNHAQGVQRLRAAGPREGRVDVFGGGPASGYNAADDRDARGVRGRGEPPALPPLLAGRPALQRVDPHGDAERRRPRGDARRVRLRRSIPRNEPRPRLLGGHLVTVVVDPAPVGAPAEIWDPRDRPGHDAVAIGQ